MSKYDFSVQEKADKENGVALGLFSPAQAEGVLGRFRVSVEEATTYILNDTYKNLRNLADAQIDERYGFLFDHFFENLPHEKIMPDQKGDYDLLASTGDPKTLEDIATRLFTTKYVEQMTLRFMNGEPDNTFNKRGNFGLQIIDQKHSRDIPTTERKVALKDGENNNLGTFNPAIILQTMIGAQQAYDIKEKQGALNPNAQQSLMMLPQFTIGHPTDRHQNGIVSKTTIASGGQPSYAQKGTIEGIKWGVHPKTGQITKIVEVGAGNLFRYNMFYAKSPSESNPDVTYQYPEQKGVFPNLTQQIIKGEVKTVTGINNYKTVENQEGYNKFNNFAKKVEQIDINVDEMRKSQYIQNHPWIDKKQGGSLAELGFTAWRDNAPLAQDIEKYSSVLTHQALNYGVDEYVKYANLNGVLMVRTVGLEPQGFNKEMHSAQFYGTDGSKKTAMGATTAYQVTPVGEGNLAENMDDRKQKTLNLFLTEGVSTASALNTTLNRIGLSNYMVVATLDAGNMQRIAEDIKTWPTDKYGRTSVMGYGDTNFILAGDNDAVHSMVEINGQMVDEVKHRCQIFADEFPEMSFEQLQAEVDFAMQNGGSFNPKINEIFYEVSPKRPEGKAPLGNTGLKAVVQSQRSLFEGGKQASIILPDTKILAKGSDLNNQDIDLRKEYGFVPKEKDGEINPNKAKYTDYDDLMRINIEQSYKIGLDYIIQAHGNTNVLSNDANMRQKLDTMCYEYGVALTTLQVYDSLERANQHNKTVDLPPKEQVFNLDEKGNLRFAQPFTTPAPAVEVESEPLSVTQQNLFNLNRATTHHVTEISITEQKVLAGFDRTVREAEISLGTPMENIFLALANNQVSRDLMGNSNIQKLKTFADNFEYKVPQEADIILKDGSTKKRELDKAKLTTLMGLKEQQGRAMLKMLSKVALTHDIIAPAIGEFTKNVKAGNTNFTQKATPAELDHADAVFLDFEKATANKLQTQNLSDQVTIKDHSDFITQARFGKPAIDSIKAKVTAIKEGKLTSYYVADSDLSTLLRSDITIYTKDSSTTNYLLKAKGVDVEKSPNKVVGIDESYKQNVALFNWHQDPETKKDLIGQTLQMHQNTPKFLEIIKSTQGYNYAENTSVSFLDTGLTFDKEKAKEVSKDYQTRMSNISQFILEKANEYTIGDHKITNLNDAVLSLMDSYVEEWKSDRKNQNKANPITQNAIDMYKAKNGDVKNIISEIGTPTQKHSYITQAMLGKLGMTLDEVDDTSNRTLEQRTEKEIGFEGPTPEFDALSPLEQIEKCLVHATALRIHRDQMNKAVNENNKAEAQTNNDQLVLVNKEDNNATGRDEYTGFNPMKTSPITESYIRPRDENSLVLKIDSKNLEFFLGAVLTGDKDFQQGYKEGKDAYQMKGDQLYGTNEQSSAEERAEARQRGKLYLLKGQYFPPRITQEMYDNNEGDEVERLKFELQKWFTSEDTFHEEGKNKDFILENHTYPDHQFGSFRKIRTANGGMAIETSYNVDGSKQYVAFEQKTKGRKVSYHRLDGEDKASEKEIHGGALLAWMLQGTGAKINKLHAQNIVKELNKMEIDEYGNKTSLSDHNKMVSKEHDAFALVTSAVDAEKVVDICKNAMAQVGGIAPEGEQCLRSVFSLAETMNHENAKEYEHFHQIDSNLKADIEEKAQYQIDDFAIRVDNDRKAMQEYQSTKKQEMEEESKRKTQPPQP